MTDRKFSLVARVTTENPEGIKHALSGIVGAGGITDTEQGFLIKTVMVGKSARDLNRALLSALRRVEKKTRLRAEWTCGATTERFFDYVHKGVFETQSLAASKKKWF